jgi:hypothetical protein
MKNPPRFHVTGFSTQGGGLLHVLTAYAVGVAGSVRVVVPDALPAPPPIGPP